MYPFHPKSCHNLIVRIAGKIGIRVEILNHFFLYRGLFRNFYPKNGGLRLCMTVGIWIICFHNEIFLVY